MKIKVILSFAAFSLLSQANAQKDEIKAAEKALKKGEFNESLAQLNQANSLLANAEDQLKAQYYSVKGNLHFEMANKNMAEIENLKNAAIAYQELLAVEKKSGKNKYSSDAATNIKTISGKLTNSAIKDQDSKNFKSGSEKLYLAYQLDNTNQDLLFYAAEFAVSSKEYDNALKYYDQLKKMNYSGIKDVFTAVNVETGKVEEFGDKTMRDLSVKAKSHKEPKDTKTPSRRGGIYTNVALILVEQGKKNEAKMAIKEARAANPDDISLITTEANLYLDDNNLVEYEKLIAEVLAKNPNNAELQFNLGVVAQKSKNNAKAEGYYKKAIEIDPNYINANLNLAILFLDGEKEIVDKMNALGNSAADNKKYDLLKEDRNKLFRNALPYLEKVVNLEPSNKDAASTLIGVYTSLEMFDKAKALKEKK
ncbi:MAG: tetratricopeptide repeat protein [Flavobacterium sp.]